MRRREFMVLVGAAVASPHVAGAQPAMPVVGFLHPRSPTDAVAVVTAFRQGLRETGFVEGENLVIEYRFAEGQFSRLRALAADLVQRRVAVIAAGARAGEVAKAATAIIPIVFLSGGDPVRTGLVESLSRPSGNVTGISMFSLDLESKRLGLLHDLIPQAALVAVLADSTSASMDFQVQEAQSAARGLDLSILVVTVASEREFEAAFATIVRERAGALIVTGSAYFLLFRDWLVGLAARHEIPAIYELNEFTEAGGLMSYGPSTIGGWRQVGIYTGRILKGEKPANLPVQQPTKYELAVNLKTAKALGLEIPPKLIALADAVIE
jgi:putative ABC transport system substrate-binding protein